MLKHSPMYYYHALGNWKCFVKHASNNKNKYNTIEFFEKVLQVYLPLS